MKRTTKLFSALLALLLILSVFASCSAADKAENDKDFLPPSPDKNNGASPEWDDEEADHDSDGFVENPFIATAENNVSTFSADVDTASYSYFRKLVNNRYTLEMLQNTAKSFRTEEFINYFRYNVTPPQNGELFGTTADIFDCPWNESTVLMRLTLQAETAVTTEGNNLVFLIDVSGSMSSADKLPLLIRTFSYLVDNLGVSDTVSIVTYSGQERVVLDGCSGAEGDRILNAINQLRANGSTNGEAGLQKAYEIAEKHFIRGGNNRIIMASDGDLNVGIASEAELKSFVEEKREAGVYLSVMGFGTGNYRDAKMETLADNGNGVYYYIDGESEAEKVLGTDLLGTLYTVAEDVKLQITFDTAYVSSYRLIGYENRILSEEDFTDDTKDAGEVGAGHQVTVCYELTLNEGARSTEKPWMKLAVRYKNPGEDVSLLNEYAIGSQQLTENISEDLRFLTCVIRTAMLLHGSRYSGNDTPDSIIRDLKDLDLSDYPERAEFLALLESIQK